MSLNRRVGPVVPGSCPRPTCRRARTQPLRGCSAAARAVSADVGAPELSDRPLTWPTVALLDDLDPEQRAVVEAPVGPVCVLAGAGTGKTRAITRRIAHLVTTGTVPAGQVLAVTFTARAAGELRSRLRSLGADGVQARTFHAAALRQLGYFWPQAVGGRMPRTREEQGRRWSPAPAGGCGTSLSGPMLRDVTAEVEWAKATHADARVLRGRGDEGRPRHAAGRRSRWSRIYAAYEEVKGESGVLDFEDLLLLTAALIEEHRFVADELRSRYRHFVVDEYQDVNPLQQRLLDAWLGGRDSLCVVGDPDQTIYSFTGASARYLSRVPASVRGDRDRPAGPQLPVQPAGRRAGEPGGRDRQARGAAPAGPGRRLHREPERGRGGRGRRAPGSPRCGRTGRRRARSRSCTASTRSRRPTSRRSPRPASRTSSAAGSASSSGRRSARPSSCCAGRRAPPTTPRRRCRPAVSQILATTGWSAGQAARRHRGRPGALGEPRRTGPAGRGRRCRAPGRRASRAFVADLAERAAAQHAPTVEGVTLASLHAAKGLEWDAVFLVGLVEGVLPISHAVDARRRSPRSGGCSTSG